MAAKRGHQAARCNLSVQCHVQTPTQCVCVSIAIAIPPLTPQCFAFRRAALTPTSEQVMSTFAPWLDSTCPAAKATSRGAASRKGKGAAAGDRVWRYTSVEQFRKFLPLELTNGADATLRVFYLKAAKEAKKALVSQPVEQVAGESVRNGFLGLREWHVKGKVRRKAWLVSKAQRGALSKGSQSDTMIMGLDHVEKMFLIDCCQQYPITVKVTPVWRSGCACPGPRAPLTPCHDLMDSRCN